jgi:hypothetical protein
MRNRASIVPRPDDGGRRNQADLAEQPEVIADRPVLTHDLVFDAKQSR